MVKVGFWRHFQVLCNSGYSCFVHSPSVTLLDNGIPKDSFLYVYLDIVLVCMNSMSIRARNSSWNIFFALHSVADSSYYPIGRYALSNRKQLKSHGVDDIMMIMALVIIKISSARARLPSCPAPLRLSQIARNNSLSKLFGRRSERGCLHSLPAYPIAFRCLPV